MGKFLEIQAIKIQEEITWNSFCSIKEIEFVVKNTFPLKNTAQMVSLASSSNI